MSALGAYDEHLVRDVGALFVGLGVLMIVAAVRGRRSLTLTAVAVWLIFAVPHTIFHALNLGPYTTADAIANVVSLGWTVLAPVIVLALLRPPAPARPAAPAAGGGRIAGGDDGRRRRRPPRRNRPARHLRSAQPRGPAPSNCANMPPLITREEALRLGELEEPTEIEALVERAWEARVERFDDSTDMCSLVNAKSGGCAEDCGFCAQSRFAEAETPMHAMMEPEQILEHARAAEAAGAHRFCMVTQGQGLSKRDFEKVLEGARLVAEHTNLKRCASIGHMSARRARRR